MFSWTCHKPLWSTKSVHFSHGLIEVSDLFFTMVIKHNTISSFSLMPLFSLDGNTHSLQRILNINFIDCKGISSLIETEYFSHNNSLKIICQMLVQHWGPNGRVGTAQENSPMIGKYLMWMNVKVWLLHCKTFPLDLWVLLPNLVLNIHWTSRNQKMI